jgi:hypothetical protein
MFGWMPAGSAEQQAVERANSALIEALTPICVERFKQDIDREQKLAALKNEYAWQRDAFVTKQGWATMPGGGKSNSRVAQECASRILAANSL